MSTLNEQLQEVQEKLGQLDANNRDHLADISKLKAQETELTNQIALEEAEQQRIQVQEEKIESIQLPYDFSEVFADPRANDIIIELIKDFQRQAYEEHNAELSAKEVAHLEELRAASDRELQLKRQNDELQTNLENARRMHFLIDGKATELEGELSEEKQAHKETIELLNETKLRCNDAESKRDAAVAEKEGIETLLTEKQAHIDTLRNEIAIGAKAAINVVNIDPTDRLAALIQESKNAKVKSALDIALENATPFRGKVITDSQAVAELQTPQEATFRPINQTSDTSDQLVTRSVISVPATNQPVDFILPATPDNFREENLQSGNAVDIGDASAVGKSVEERLATLEGRLTNLENQVSGMNFQR